MKQVLISELWKNEDVFSKRFQRAQYAIQQKQSVTIWGERPKISPADKTIEAIRNLFTAAVFGFAFVGSIYFQWKLSVAVLLMVSSFITFFGLLSVRHVLIKECKRKWEEERLELYMPAPDTASFEKMVIDVVAYAMLVPPEILYSADSEFELRNLHRFAFPPLADEIAYGLELSLGHMKPFSEIQQAVHDAASLKPNTLNELAAYIEVGLNGSAEQE